MIQRTLQSFSIFLLLALAISAPAAELKPGAVAHLSFRNVDGHDLSTSSGYITIITVVTRETQDKAQAVADLVPDRYLGNPRYHYVTLVNFQRKIFGPFQGLTRAVIRQRLDAEADKLRPQYAAKKINRNPRDDIFVIADFDGSAVQKLGLASDANGVSVFVFNGRGKLVERWNGVPPDDSLGKAIVAAE
ncbi:MAG: hypothetical protein M3Y86_13190 [Verrucomicrobiota bacterium]|nr:hypothetical protein [Verrucomicrobiota bacterium]